MNAEYTYPAVTGLRQVLKAIKPHIGKEHPLAPTTLIRLVFTTNTIEGTSMSAQAIARSTYFSASPSQHISHHSSSVYLSAEQIATLEAAMKGWRGNLNLVVTDEHLELINDNLQTHVIDCSFDVDYSQADAIFDSAKSKTNHVKSPAVSVSPHVISTLKLTNLSRGKNEDELPVVIVPCHEFGKRGMTIVRFSDHFEMVAYGPAAPDNSLDGLQV